MSLIDLSVPLDEKTPIYPGDPATRIEPAAIIGKDGYCDHYVCVGTHVGTHIDAPMHMIAGGRSLGQFPLEQFVGRGVCVNTGKDLSVAALARSDIREGDIVLFNTGMHTVYHEPAYYNDYPAITEDMAQYLIEKKVKMVGVDMCSVDHEPFPVHKILLDKGILIIENLTNLFPLQGKEFIVRAFPLRLDIDASPARVIAETAA